jgi:hypothetical protein
VGLVAQLVPVVPVVLRVLLQQAVPAVHYMPAVLPDTISLLD